MAVERLVVFTSPSELNASPGLNALPTIHFYIKMDATTPTTAERWGPAYEVEERIEKAPEVHHRGQFPSRSSLM